MSTIKINGGQTSQFVWCKNKVLSNSEITSIVNSTSTPSWDVNTVALATFDNNINASNIPSVSHEILGYRIFRQKINDSVLMNVGEVSGSALIVRDYMIPNKGEYIYYISPVLNNGGDKIFGVPMVSTEVKAQWSDWIVYGTIETEVEYEYKIDPNNIWRFGLNVESSPVKQNLDKSIYNNIGRFSKIGVGDKNYSSGSLSCKIGNISCGSLSKNSYGYFDSQEMIDRWNEFVASRDLKILKNRKGAVLPIEIIESEIEYSDWDIEQNTTLSFSYVQVDLGENIAVYGVDNNVY